MRFTIDCSACSRQRTSSCQDCIVSFVTNREPDEAVVIDAAEFAALRRLSAAGLIPSVRNDAANRIEWVTDVELGWPDRPIADDAGSRPSEDTRSGEASAGGPDSLRDAG
ncbi:MAG: hypothetical protein OEV40_00830 [Acidimicrobiia bacterium]|nr:hypothetical protein [Acidimicrobiia bacterium]